MTAAAYAELPPTFTYTDARKRGISDRKLCALQQDETVEKIGRGLFRKNDAELAEWNLLEIAHRNPDATLCLITACNKHNLTDLIPMRTDVAIPRGAWRPRTSWPTSWHVFDPKTFEIGREPYRIDSHTTIWIYNRDRCVIDLFRRFDDEGSFMAYEALRRWLRMKGTMPSNLSMMARHFPRVQRRLRNAFEVLL